MYRDLFNCNLIILSFLLAWSCIDNVCTFLYNIFVRYKGFRIDFSEEKNLLLKETRNIGFEDVIIAIEGKKFLDDLKHNNKKYAHQRILVIKIDEYVYAVPYTIDLKKKIVFLKTIYPSRVLTNKYIKGGVKKWK